MVWAVGTYEEETRFIRGGRTEKLGLQARERKGGRPNLRRRDRLKKSTVISTLKI